MTGLGHSASVAAMIAAASSSVGAGDITSPDGGGNVSNDTLEIVLALPLWTEARQLSSALQTSRRRRMTTVPARRS